MAFKINYPTYELNLPSTDEVVKYRPFLVKEEKLLLIAQQSKDTKTIVETMKNVIQNCIVSKLDISSLPMFDIEYLLLHIRARSVGETAELNVICPDDNETYVPVSVDLLNINVEMPEGHSNKIKLTDSAELYMTYPAFDLYDDFLGKLKEDKEKKGAGVVDNLFKLFGNSIHQIVDGEDVYDGKDLSDKEKVDFIESLTQKQFADVRNFFNTMPRLQHKVEVENPKTKVKSEVVLEGVQSFF